MSTALQFTSVFNPANPPQKLNIGGMGMSPKPVIKSRSLPIAASKALEARGIKTEAIKDLETPPPVSVADTKVNDPMIIYKGPTSMSDTADVFYPGLEMEQGSRPQDDFFQRYQMIKGAPGARQMFEMQQPKGKVITPNELKMILDAQQNMGGIMASNMTTPMREETGLAALANMNYIDKV